MKSVRALLMTLRSTSQAHTQCGTVDARARPDQATLCGVRCGHPPLADAHAVHARRDRAAVMRPMGSVLRGSEHATPRDLLQWMIDLHTDQDVTRACLPNAWQPARSGIGAGRRIVSPATDSVLMSLRAIR